MHGTANVGERRRRSGSSPIPPQRYDASMAHLTPKDAEDYRARWDLANRREIAELRTTSIEQKFRQLCALVASRHAFPLDPNREKLNAEVAARWCRIRAYYGE